MNRIRISIRSIAAALVAGVACAMPAFAQVSITPPELQGVDIVEHRSDMVPLDATFIDEKGNTVKFGDFFHKDRPVILQMGYFRCPMLCNLVLNGAIAGLKDLDWSAGKTFEIVSISLNPTEPHELAKAKRDQYAVEYGRPGAENGMHFLVGEAKESKRVADAVGFGFRVQSNGDISHAAAIFMITPEGRISQYLYGAQFEPKDLRLALLEASEGKIGSTWDRFILWCHVYKAGSGYVLFATRLMQLGGAAMLVILAVGLTILWRSDARRKSRAASLGTAVTPTV